jgi:hypothetical protein
MRLSRRAFVAAGGAALVAGCTESDDSLPLVRPVWSEVAARRVGVNAHPNFLQTGYEHAEEWLEAVSDLGVGYYRGLYAPQLPSTAAVVSRTEELGLQWGMIVCADVHEPVALIEERIAAIAQQAAGICLYVEGVNEPNYARDGGFVPPDWAERTVERQAVVWEAVRREPALSDVTVLGPSLQATVATDEDYARLTSLGLLEYVDAVGVHVYPGGHHAAHGMAPRLEQVRRHWPDRPVWVTETGYTNAVDSAGGHRPVPEDVAGDYAPAALLEAVDQDYHVVWYELLDDVDEGPKDLIEHNFGLLATQQGAGPPWRSKPAAAALSSLLAQLRDPGPRYVPPAVQLRVRSSAKDLRWTALGKRDGSVTLYLRRATNGWDPTRAEPVRLQPVRATVVTPEGDRAVTVDHRVAAISL